MSEQQARQMVLWLLDKHGRLERRTMAREYGRVVKEAADYLYLTGAIDFKHGEYRALGRQA